MITDTEMKMLELLVSRCDDTQMAFLKVLIGTTQAPQVRDYAGLPNVVALKVGDMVIFKPRKTKPAITGRIKSINEKTYTIEKCSDNGPGWRIGFGSANIRKMA